MPKRALRNQASLGRAATPVMRPCAPRQSSQLASRSSDDCLHGGTRTVALAWKDSLEAVTPLKVLPSTVKDLEAAWTYFERPDLHRLSAVDAISFVLM